MIIEGEEPVARWATTPRCGPFRRPRRCSATSSNSSRSHEPRSTDPREHRDVDRSRTRRRAQPARGDAEHAHQMTSSTDPAKPRARDAAQRLRRRLQRHTIDITWPAARSGWDGGRARALLPEARAAIDAGSNILILSTGDEPDRVPIPACSPSPRPPHLVPTVPACARVSCSSPASRARSTIRDADRLRASVINRTSCSRRSVS